MSFYNFRILFYSEDHRKRFMEENPELLLKTKFFDKKHLINRNEFLDPNVYLLSLLHRRALNSIRKTMTPYAIYCEGDPVDLRIKHGRNRKKVAKKPGMKEEDDNNHDHERISHQNIPMVLPKEQCMEHHTNTPEKEIIKKEEC